MMKLTINDLRKLSSIAKTAAINAGEYIQSQIDQQHAHSIKFTGTSLASQIVTEVDMNAQKMILSHLNKSIQDYDLGLLTEELADDQSRITKDYFWCIDPMDGTLAFTEQVTGYAVSIALVSQAGDPLIGVVYVPDLMQCFSSVKGEGVLLNDASFIREEDSSTSMHVYMDRSFPTEKYYDAVKVHLDNVANRHDTDTIKLNVTFGAVRNAIGVMTSPKGCYFKFPKKSQGGGSIWDFSATRLFFEELGLWVSSADGQLLPLNNPQTTFMNEEGVLFATNEKLVRDIIELKEKVSDS